MVILGYVNNKIKNSVGDLRYDKSKWKQYTHYHW